MNENEKELTQNKIKRTLKIRILVTSFLILLLGTCITTYAWLYFERRAIAVKEIADPTAINISAGNQENYMYIDLSGIDLYDGTYKDFVFGISGTNINTFQMQLSFTTNNQFTFEVYRATEGAVPGGVTAISTVYYITHESTPRTLTYYTTEARKLSGTLVNQKGDENLGKNKTDSTGDPKNYYQNTYGTYDNVDKYAIPLYWQINDIAPENVENHAFCNYFILRVKWDSENRTNNKETDILYISAKRQS